MLATNRSVMVVASSAAVQDAAIGRKYLTVRSTSDTLVSPYFRLTDPQTYPWHPAKPERTWAENVFASTSLSFHPTMWGDGCFGAVRDIYCLPQAISFKIIDLVNRAVNRAAARSSRFPAPPQHKHSRMGEHGDENQSRPKKSSAFPCH